MSFELCSFPPSLFEDREMLLKADKPPLAKAIVGFVKKEKDKSFLGGEIFEHIEGKEEEEVSDILINSIDEPIDIIEDAGASTYQFVLDGGSLLHRISWSRTSTYDDIAKSLASFVHKTYEAAVVVFDGYENGASIKDNSHRRRRRDKSYPLITFSPDMTASCKKETFLLNPKNKVKFIELLTFHLRKFGRCRFAHC